MASQITLSPHSPPFRRRCSRPLLLLKGRIAWTRGVASDFGSFQAEHRRDWAGPPQRLFAA